MSDLHLSIETLIQKYIHQLSKNKHQKKSTHLSSHSKFLLGDLYNTDSNGIIFVNYFGNIEYSNPNFSKFFMLDKCAFNFNNILDLPKLALTATVEDEFIYIDYPNSKRLVFKMLHQIVHFQKSVLLQFQFIDITDSVNQTHFIKAFKERTNDYLSHLDAPMFIINSDGIISDTPTPKLNILGHTYNHIVNQSIFEYLPFDYATKIINQLPNAVEKQATHFLHQTEHNKVIQVFDTTLFPLPDKLILCCIKDVSDLNTMSSTIEYLNTYDSLTGFYNMAFYEDKINTLNNSGYMPIGAYILTLQGLKPLNIKLGHHKCDRLIIEIALNIQSASTQYEFPCRISGNTFIVLFPNCSNKTFNKFITVMNQHIKRYQIDYNDYLLTYSQKTIIITDSTNDLGTVLKGLLL